MNRTRASHLRSSRAALHRVTSHPGSGWATRGPRRQYRKSGREGRLFTGPRLLIRSRWFEPSPGSHFSAASMGSTAGDLHRLSWTTWLSGHRSKIQHSSIPIAQVRRAALISHELGATGRRGGRYVHWARREPSSSGLLPSGVGPHPTQNESAWTRAADGAAAQLVDSDRRLTAVRLVRRGPLRAS